jgi:hypothetical protein
MEFLKKLIGKVRKDQSELDAAIGAIVELEEKHREAVIALNGARAALEQRMEAEIIDGSKAADHSAGATTIIAAQAKADSLASMIRKARTEAAALVGADRGTRAAATADAKQQITEITANQGRRLARAVAEFAHQHGLTIKWPGPAMAGSMTIPTFGVDADEVLEIQAEAQSAAVPFADPEAGKLADLREKIATWGALDSQPPDQAIDMLVARAKRKQ